MSYPGSQSNRPVTFTSESGDSSKVIISYSAGSSNNYVVWLNGADYITLSRMTIQPTYYYYGYAVVVNNGSLNCNVSNNMIRHTSPGYYYTGGVYSTSDIDNNLNISGNTITGFYYGAQLYGNSGSSANYETGLSISGNQFSNIGYTAIYLNYQKNFNISGNTISNVGEGDMGIYLSQTSDAFTIQGNKIINAKYSYNIYISGHIGNSANKGRIFNNFLSNYYYYGYILRMDGSNYVDIDYNSMNFHTVANYQMLYFGSNSNYNLRNNSIAHNAGGVAMYVSGTLPSICNYNNWYTSGAVLINQAGTNRSNLAAWKAATSKDANSVSVNPLYFSNDDLHTTLISLDSVGTNIIGIY
jgi:parallel beta-helix repeat protein